MGDVEAALAFVARRQGSSALPRSAWVHVVSLDLGWMPPSQAAAFVGRAEAAGLLAPADGLLRLAIDPAGVPAPLGFRPDPQAVPAVRDGFTDWVQRVAAARQQEPAEVMAEVAARQAALGGHLMALPALLWVGAEAGLDVRQAAAGFRP